MKTKLYIILTLVMVLFTVELQAQANDTTVHKTVTVTREFQPTINDAGKIINNPQVVAPDVNRTKPNYLNVTTPLETSFNIQHLRANELLHTPIDAKKAFARVGFGTPLNSLADFSYPLLSDEDNRLDFSLNHLGAFLDKIHSKTEAKLQYNHLFDKFDLYLGADASHNYYNYYARSFSNETPVILSDFAAQYPNIPFAEVGYSSNITYLSKISALPQFNTIWRMGGEAGARSLPLSKENLIFDFGLKYRRLQATNNDIFENHFKLNADFSVPFELNRIGMDVELHFLQDNANRTYENSTYSVFKIAPHYLYEGDKLNMKLGIKTGISGGNNRTFTPSPDVFVQWNAWEEYLALYGIATGDLSINSLDKIYDENRYIAPNIRVKDTYTPLDAIVGIKLSPVHNLLIDMYGEFKYIYNQYYYRNRFYVTGNSSDIDNKDFFHNRFDVSYSTTRRTSAGARISWDYKELVNIYAKGAYHFWDTKEVNVYRAWLMPEWDTDFGANLRIFQDWNISTQFIFQDGRYARLSNLMGTKMAAVMDLNASASYSYREWMSIFIKGNNLLNKKYELLPGYDVQGLNVLGGVSFSF